MSTSPADAYYSEVERMADEIQDLKGIEMDDNEMTKYLSRIQGKGKVSEMQEAFQIVWEKAIDLTWCLKLERVERLLLGS